MYAVQGRYLAVALMLLALSACRSIEWRPWRGPEPPDGPCEIERIRDISYCAGAPADRFRHRLDLYLPKGKKDFPVVVLVHGGAWLVCDNRTLGLYTSVAEFLASQGIGVVAPNYRLSPDVKHPEHIQDVARAFAWTKRHIAEHGGRPDQLFVVGHSAGGHLAALLATDEQYLKAERCQGADVRGVVCLCGVYRIPLGNLDVFLGGTAPMSLRFDQVMPMRGDLPGDPRPADVPGIPRNINPFALVFGNDPETRRNASPIAHVRPGLPPFLFLNPEKDLPLLPGMAEEMHRRLLLHGCESHLQKIDNRNHNSIMFRAIDRSDPAARLIVEFVRGHL
ncbi:MAG: alpha/beta hydrolase [Planctomycetes bacterium]|nr:alpha/beta hydrolase [Planctomycetota bacterium]